MQKGVSLCWRYLWGGDTQPHLWCFKDSQANSSQRDPCMEAQKSRIVPLTHHISRDKDDGVDLCSCKHSRYLLQAVKQHQWLRLSRLGCARSAQGSCYLLMVGKSCWNRGRAPTAIPACPPSLVLISSSGSLLLCWNFPCFVLAQWHIFAEGMDCACWSPLCRAPC